MSLRILYAEDDADIQAIARFALEELGGFTIRTCQSGRAALAEAPDFRPDLVLLDVMMPEMDGPATLAALRALPGMETVPVAFMTAKAQTHEMARYRALGIAAVITKPFDPMTLADQVRAIHAGQGG
ncbi:MAG: response regulator [Rhodospirillales bacterium]|nr:response regulator [Rhodospirillales bacterium]